MIRINLLPQAKKQARGAAASSGGGAGTTPWVAAYFGGSLLACIVFAIVYFGKQSELDEQRARNTTLEQRIAAVTAQSANIDEVRAQLTRSQELEQVVNELQRARFGPTRVLMEVSRILSTGGGPTIDPQRLEEIRRINPLAGYNRSWDTRRLWLSQLREEQRALTIIGAGKTNEDVAEFLRRLSLSDSFSEVRLTKTELVRQEIPGAAEATGGALTGVDMVRFELTATVRY